MSNVYHFTECCQCSKLTEILNTFIVHGSSIDGISLDPDWPPGQKAAHFWGNCGNYVELPKDQKVTSESCNCGNFQYQGWNYEDPKDHWEEPPAWKLNREEEE